MGNLKSLPEKTSFDSSWDDVLNDFYIPALSCSKRYYRVAGYFSSTSIAVAAKGQIPYPNNPRLIEVNKLAMLEKVPSDERKRLNMIL